MDRQFNSSSFLNPKQPYKSYTLPLLQSLIHLWWFMLKTRFFDPSALKTYKSSAVIQTVITTAERCQSGDETISSVGLMSQVCLEWGLHSVNMSYIEK